MEPTYGGQTTDERWLIARRLVLGLFIIVVVFSGYQVIRSVIIARTTGILRVRSSMPNALLSVSRDDSEAKVIGTGQAKVRLAPGSYHLVALAPGARANILVVVKKQGVTTSYIKPVPPPHPPSVDDIHFVGTGDLLNAGFTSAQVDSVKQAIFRFKPAAKAVTINGLKPAARPTRQSPFVMAAKVKVDSTPYTAMINYTDSNSAPIQLINDSGVTVFDSATPQSTGDE